MQLLQLVVQPHTSMFWDDVPQPTPPSWYCCEYRAGSGAVTRSPKAAVSAGRKPGVGAGHRGNLRTRPASRLWPGRPRPPGRRFRVPRAGSISPSRDLALSARDTTPFLFGKTHPAPPPNGPKPFKNILNQKIKIQAFSRARPMTHKHTREWEWLMIQQWFSNDPATSGTPLLSALNARRRMNTDSLLCQAVCVNQLTSTHSTLAFFLHGFRVPLRFPQCQIAPAVAPANHFPTSAEWYRVSFRTIPAYGGYGAQCCGAS